MLRVPSTDQEPAQSPYDSLYLQSHDGIHRMLSHGCCGRLRGWCTRPIPPSQAAGDISQAMYEGLPMTHSGELAAFVHAEQLLNAHKFARTLHRDNARTLRRHLSAVVEQNVTHCVLLSIPARPFSYPRPIASDQPCGTSHIWLQDGVLRHRV